MLSRRLSVSNDIRVQKLIQNKRLASTIEGHLPKIKKKMRMFDQFLIIGAPPTFEYNNPEPVILSSYPKVYESMRPESEVQMLLSFSFPNGMAQIQPDTTGKRTILIEFLYVLKEETESLYGICVHFRGNENLFFATEKNVKYPFCFCLLTATPFFSSHFTFLTYLTLLSVQKVEVCPHQISEENEQIFLPPIQEKIFANLVEDQTYKEICVFPGLKASQLFNDELNFYMSLPTNSNEPYPKITLSPKIELCLPLHFTKNQCLAYSSFHALFNTFKISEIVTIYTAVLLEMRVVFTSKKYLHILSMSIIAIISLLEPFKMKSEIILPILPSNPTFLQILNLPVPYIIGTTSSLTGDADLIVDIDSFELKMNTKIPQIPQRNELIQKLMKILAENASKCRIPQYNVDSGQPSQDFLKFIDNYDHYNFPFIYISLTKFAYIFPPKIIDSIIEVFRNHLAPPLADMINGCFVTDSTDPEKPVTVCNNDLFLCQLPDCDHEFYEKFTQTNNWENFVDALSEEKNSSFKK